MFLGLDLSTQQLKGVVIDQSLKLHYTTVVAFDADLPHYKTKSGTYSDNKRVLSPVSMWLEALDLLCTRMVENEVPLNEIRAVSGSGQQHGSVYWSQKAIDLFEHGLEVERSLKEQVSPVLSWEMSPNWQDASTQEECEEIEASVGGAQKLAEITGSRAHHRFTGPQILHLRKTQPDLYEKTARISLVSSFLCSLFLGCIAPIDPSDVCGMNLWDIRKEKFDHEILEVVGGQGKGEELATKLGHVTLDGAEKLGRISSYFQSKYNFSSQCQIIPFTGDNPATILSLPLHEKNAMISLGTSTTMLLSTPEYIPSPSYHLFAHPTTTNYHMAMLCYKNGSLSREHVRDEINTCRSLNDENVKDQADWSQFNDLAMRKGPPSSASTGKSNRLGFFYSLPEIIPPAPKGTYRYLIKDGQPKIIYPDSKDEDAKLWHVPEDDARAILDGQFLDIRMRSQPFFDRNSSHPNSRSKQPNRVYTVGGASKNPAIISVLSQCIGGTDGVFRQLGSASANACAIGGANKAAWAMLRHSGETFEDFVARNWKEEEGIEKISDGYEAGIWENYGEMIEALTIAEERIIQGLDRA